MDSKMSYGIGGLANPVRHDGFCGLDECDDKGERVVWIETPIGLVRIYACSVHGAAFERQFDKEERSKEPSKS